jgi:glyoxylase-like metal-dependent hydrolase (beta-lactamase superfamily II)
MPSTPRGQRLSTCSDVPASPSYNDPTFRRCAVIVERIWTGNSYRNYNYLIACPDTGEALAIDPLDHGKCLQAAKKNGWRITQILNTHEHHDHTGGNAAVVEPPAPS